MLWLAGCSFIGEVRTECAPLRLTTGRPECDGIALCVETFRPPFVGPAYTSRRSWFQSAEGVNIEVAPAPTCTSCEPSLQDMVCGAASGPPGRL